MSNDSAARPLHAGRLFLVTAPSGAGKSSLVNALLKLEPSLKLSISHTTRALVLVKKMVANTISLVKLSS